MAFTIVPYDAEFHEISSDVAASLPKDLKKSGEGAAWLRDSRRFHVIITMKKERLIFYNGIGSDARLVAREHIGKTIEVLTEKDAEALRRFKSLRRRAQANNFNVSLLSDVWVLGVF